jgi:hypothetical protein
MEYGIASTAIAAPPAGHDRTKIGRQGTAEAAALRRIWPPGDRQSGLIDVWNL